MSWDPHKYPHLCPQGVAWYHRFGSPPALEKDIFEKWYTAGRLAAWEAQSLLKAPGSLLGLLEPSESPMEPPEGLPRAFPGPKIGQEAEISAGVYPRELGPP